MTQEVKLLKVADLVLWTENPRDPIRATAKDQDIVDRALANTHGKWGLRKLVKQMGASYDFSELPTVVLRGKHPIVYDGNRRVVLGKIKLGLVSADGVDPSIIPSFPEKIPCNVCTEAVALKNVLRKHADTGSWLPLERDIFLHKHMKKAKSLFLVLEERTGIISANPYMNQRFVKEEIFSEDVLAKIGLEIDGDTFSSKHTSGDTATILADIARKVRDKVISTRKNRGDVIKVLDSATKKILTANKQNKFKTVRESKDKFESVVRQPPTPRTPPKETPIFGDTLVLKSGDVNNFYRDLTDLHTIYLSNKHKFSPSFPSVIRMAMRLLVETAAQDIGENLAVYVKARFQDAKALLDKDQKTTLSSQSVSESSIVGLLQMGAHNYTAASNIDQAMAISLVLGRVLTMSHGMPPSR